MTDFIKRFNEKMDAAIETAKAKRMEDERFRLLTTVGQDVAQMLMPVIQEMAQSAKMNKQELRDAMWEALGTLNARELNIDTKPLIEAIQVAMGGIKVPQPMVHYTAPPIKIPDVVMPDEMGIKGFLDLLGVFKNADQNPISVQLRDFKGNPLDLSSFGGMAVSGGGGSFRRVIVDDIRASASSVIDQALGAVKVTGSLSATLSLDYGSGEIGANTPRFVMATDAVASVYVTGASGSIAAAIVDSSGVAYSGSNPVPIAIISGSTGGTQYDDAGNAAPGTGGLTMARDANGSVYSLRIGTGDGVTALRIVQASDALASINVMQIAGNAADSGAGASSTGSLRVILASDSILSTITSTDAVATQVLPAMLSKNFGFNGATWDRIHTGGFDSGGALRVSHATDIGLSVNVIAGTVAVSSITASVAAAIVDSTGVAYSGSNPVPITGTVVVSSVTASVAAAIVDSTGVEYSGSNPLPITIISGALTSTLAVGDSAARSADNGGNPVKVGGIARTTQNTAYADGDRANFTTDKLGRQLNRPVQVRDLIITAYVSLATGTEATLLAASAGSFHDLLYVMMANSSDAAVLVDIRGVTAGNIVATVAVPANGTAGVSMGAVPIPQSGADTGNNWTVDMPDITGTTVYVTALFSREV